MTRNLARGLRPADQRLKCAFRLKEGFVSAFDEGASLAEVGGL